MWFFKVPEIFFGEDALSQLATLRGQRAIIVTDENIVRLGFAVAVQNVLLEAGIESTVFAEVEPDPSLQTVRRGAQAMLEQNPDWIIGLGGGSSMDASKAMWILYERPDMDPAAINPFDELGLRQKARLICIPTTAGTGSEASYGIVLTDTEHKRKLTLGSREATPDMAIIDPYFTAHLPGQITADTGLDVLSHAVEAYTCNWANDFTDGLCLQALRLVFQYLPRAVLHGANDMEAREKMANAATIAGMTLGNSQVALAHALGHAAGAQFKKIPHGRITTLFLPYTISFIANGRLGRYADLAAVLGLAADNNEDAAAKLIAAIHDLMRTVQQPLSLQEAGVELADFEAALALMCDQVEEDSNTLLSPRMPERHEVEKLFRYAYEGKMINF